MGDERLRLRGEFISYASASVGINPGVYDAYAAAVADSAFLDQMKRVTDVFEPTAGEGLFSGPG